MNRVEIRDHVEPVSLDRRGDAGRSRQVQDGGAGLLEQHPAVGRGCESARPACGAPADERSRGHHHVAGQILVLAAEAVDEPRPQGGITTEVMARLHHQLRRSVVELAGRHRVEHADLVGMLGDVGQEVRKP